MPAGLPASLRLRACANGRVGGYARLGSQPVPRQELRRLAMVDVRCSPHAASASCMPRAGAGGAIGCRSIADPDDSLDTKHRPAACCSSIAASSAFITLRPSPRPHATIPNERRSYRRRAVARETSEQNRTVRHLLSRRVNQNACYFVGQRQSSLRSAASSHPD